MDNRHRKPERVTGKVWILSAECRTIKPTSRSVELTAIDANEEQAVRIRLTAEGATVVVRRKMINNEATAKVGDVLQFGILPDGSILMALLLHYAK